MMSQIVNPLRNDGIEVEIASCVTAKNEIEDKIDDMKSTGIKTGMDVSEGVEKLENQLSQEKQKIYANLNRWERVQLARHPKRPYSSDYISRITDYWFELL